MHLPADDFEIFTLILKPLKDNAGKVNTNITRDFFVIKL